MSLECPNNNGYEVWCADNIDNMKVLDDNECKGKTSDKSLNGGKNGGCSGYGINRVYLTDDGLNMGGWHRGSLYAI